MFQTPSPKMIGAFALAAMLPLAGCSNEAFLTPRILPQQARSAAASVRYSITILQGIGGTSSSADGINNSGWITGWSTLSGPNLPEHAVLWIKGRKVDLGTLGGPNSVSNFPKKGVTDDVPVSAETAIKDPLGEDFSFFGTGRTVLGAYWRKGVMHALPTLGGNNGLAIGNNDRGQIVGAAETERRDPKCMAPQVLRFEAVLWDSRSHRAKELAPLKGDTLGLATAINDKDEVVGGTGRTCTAPQPSLALHPVLWKNGKPMELATLGGKMNNAAYIINQRGDIAGSSDPTGDATTHAVLWRNPKTIVDLGTLPGDFSSVVSSMNDKGQIVGDSCDKKGNCRGFIWRDGSMADLNTLIPKSSRYYVFHAGDINDDGIIVGEVLDKKTGATPAFMAIPHLAPRTRRRGGLISRTQFSYPGTVTRG